MAVRYECDHCGEQFEDDTLLNKVEVVHDGTVIGEWHVCIDCDQEELHDFDAPGRLPAMLDPDVELADESEHRLAGAKPAGQQGPTDEHGDSTFDQRVNSALEELRRQVRRVNCRERIRGGL